MDLIGVPPERFSIQNGVYLHKDGLPPAAYLAKTCFQEIHCFFHVSPYNSRTKTPEDLSCWHLKLDILLEQLRLFSQQYQVPGSNVNVCNLPSKWWEFTGAENEKASRQQEYQCKWSTVYISSWRMPERAWYSSHCWCLQQAHSGCGCGWLVSNLFWYTAYIQMQFVPTVLLDSGDSTHQ